MNAELLLKVRQAVLDEPDAFNMHVFVTASKESSCGTVACLAGFTVHIAESMSLKTLYKKASRGGGRICFQEAQHGCFTIEVIARNALDLDPD